jgi:hypothetical protein
MRYWGGALKVMLVLAAGLVAVAGAVASTRGSGSTSQPQPQTQTQTQAQTQAQAGARGLTCMPDPSVCGFPDRETTGVTPGSTLAAVNGVVTLSTPGQVYENKLVTGSIAVTAPNVTIRNVRLINRDTWYAIRVTPGGIWDRSDANLLIENSEIDLGGVYTVKGIAFNGYTARHVFFHNGADCAHFGENVVIEDSMCVLGPDTDGDGWPDTSSFCGGDDHFDGFQSDGGRNITLRHNTIRNPCGQTSGILMSSNTSSIRDVSIVDNLMAGGGYTLYCNAGPDVANETVTGNVFARTWYSRGGYWGPTAHCEDADVFSGVVWDGNYVRPPAGETPGGTGATPVAATPGVTYWLSATRARRLTRTALARELGRRYTRRAKGMRTSCRRRSRSTVACSVRWTGRARRGQTSHRYRGSVTVTRAAADGWRYSLRIRNSWSSGCSRCSVLVKRTRSV